MHCQCKGVEGNRKQEAGLFQELLDLVPVVLYALSRALYSSIKTTSSSSSRRRTASFRVLFKRWINPNLHSLFANRQLKSGIHSVAVSLFYSNNSNKKRDGRWHCLAWDFRLTYAFCFVLNVCCLRDMIRGVTLNDPTCLSDTVNLRLTVLLVRRLKTT